MPSPAAASPPALPRDHVIRHRPFVLFWLGRLAATIATLTQGVAIGWQVYVVARLSHSVEESAFLVGMVGLAQFLPLFCLALLAGETADRYDRRRIQLICYTLHFCGACAFFLLSLQPAPSLTLLFVVASVIGLARAFAMPAGSALAPTLVPRALLPQAIAFNSLSVQVGMVVGPWLGGLLCTISPSEAYATTMGLYLLAAGTSVGLLLYPLPPQAPPSPGSRVALIREGLAYVWSHKVVLGAISLDLFAVLLGGVTALLPVFARDVLQIGADGFGLLRSGPAIGGGLMAIYLTLRPVKRHAGVWMLSAVAVYGVATVAFALTSNLWLAMAMLIVLGAADGISVFVRQTLIQVLTPDAMRGRVSAVSSLFISASNELGEFESGVVARFLGPVGAALFGGLGSLAVTAVWAKLFPALRKADRLDA